MQPGPVILHLTQPQPAFTQRKRPIDLVHNIFAKPLCNASCASATTCTYLHPSAARFLKQSRLSPTFYQAHSFHYDLQIQLRTSCMFLPSPSRGSTLTCRQSRESFDSRRSPPPEELLSPLATLYPHVAALQPQYNPTSCTFTGYRHTGYWAAAYTTQPLDEPPLTRRPSGTFLQSTPHFFQLTIANCSP